MKRAHPLAAVLTAVVLVASTARPAAAAEKGRHLGEGEGVFRPVTLGTLLKVPLKGELGAQERAYLGVAGEGGFTLADVRADLLVVEFFNASCYACAMMAPVMVEAWKKVEGREDLRGRVRFLGIGVGNSGAQVKTFHDQYATPFPAVPDAFFEAFDAVGSAEGTPYIILLRRDGAAVEARGQVGAIRDVNRVVGEIAAALEGVATAPAALPMVNAGSSWRLLKPPLAAEEVNARLVAAAADAGLAGAGVTAVPVSAEETFYRLAAGDRHLWAMVAGRSKICNVCHDIFFIVVFDDGGRIVGFSPITITKYKNVELDAKDVAFLRSRVVGRFLTQEIPFDPAVDAVSTATMSSELVFDTLRRLRETYQQMVKSGKVTP
jgi:hypothetical protein